MFFEMPTFMNLYMIMVIICGMSGLSFAESDNEAVTEFHTEDDASTKVLSRRKRYLVFPDGSSFQLVFCTQTHGYLQVGDIVWFGSTAALAWELPSDPNLFSFFKKSKLHKGLRRNDASKHIYYLDEDGKVISKVPYHRRPIVNPAFAKRSVDDIMMKNKTINLSIKDMHGKSKKMMNDYLDNLHESNIDFHREGRKSLYGKLEKFFQGLGWNGRECVLKMLCKNGKVKRKQGTFLEEIIRATFTLPQGRKFDTEHHEYDDAHGATADCSELYPRCEYTYGSLLFDKQ